MKKSLYFILAIPLSWVTGCTSSPLPPRLSSTEAGRLSELPLPHTVGVIPYERPVYSDKLTVELNAAGVFSKVAPIEEFTNPPDFVAVVEKGVHGNAMFPVATLVTGGVIPTAVGENHGLVFSIAPFSRRSRKTMVDASYRGTTTLGWVASAVNISPDYTSSNPDKSERFYRMLAYRTLVALRPGKRSIEP